MRNLGFFSDTLFAPACFASRTDVYVVDDAVDSVFACNDGEDGTLAARFLRILSHSGRPHLLNVQRWHWVQSTQPPTCAMKVKLD